jgi:hypothetical protein
MPVRRIYIRTACRSCLKTAERLSPVRHVTQNTVGVCELQSVYSLNGCVNGNDGYSVLKKVSVTLTETTE